MQETTTNWECVAQEMADVDRLVMEGEDAELFVNDPAGFMRGQSLYKFAAKMFGSSREVWVDQHVSEMGRILLEKECLSATDSYEGVLCFDRANLPMEKLSKHPICILVKQDEKDRELVEKLFHHVIEFYAFDQMIQMGNNSQAPLQILLCFGKKDG